MLLFDYDEKQDSDAVNWSEWILKYINRRSRNLGNIFYLIKIPSNMLFNLLNSIATFNFVSIGYINIFQKCSYDPLAEAMRCNSLKLSPEN